MIKEKLGKRIAELRKRYNLSQEILAEKLDISQKALSKIETGHNFLTAETLEKLLMVFNLKSNELFDFEHLGNESELIEDINIYINEIKNDKSLLIILHKITQALAKK